MPSLILLNKPFKVLTQFTDSQGRPTLANYIQEKGFYAAGRLDNDSEGLLLLTNNGKLQNKITDPKHKLAKTYWVQVEGLMNEEALNKIRNGIMLKDGLTQPALAKSIIEPDIWARIPPIRERKHIPSSWIEISICEGKNRQIRRMTAAIGFPTLRLIRYSIGKWTIGDLQPGEYRKINN
jgi:23S rRNA pseudouridine2457 synthase